MAGVTGFGSYIPRYRLPREVIAKEWGQSSMGGEKAVANHDEDSLTLAINAATNCFADTSPVRLDAVFFASTTSPYREKQAAATVAAVLDTGPRVRTADFTDSLRAGTSALRAGLDGLSAGAKTVMLCAGDCRMGEPDSPAEQNYGDAGAAVLLGNTGVIAEVLGAFSVSEDFHGTWRTEEQDYLHSFPGAFETKFGYARFVTAAIRGVLKETDLNAPQISTAVIAAPNPRALVGVAKAVGLDPKKQIGDTLWALLGDTGTTQPLLLLAAALERAQPGEIILLASYGDGGDAFVFKVTDAIATYRTARSIYSQIETKRPLASYGKYARFRKLIRKDATAMDVSTPVVLFRDQKAVLPLYGGKCPRCRIVQFPKHRICVECGDREGLEEVKLSRRGSLFTFTNDFLFESPDQPVTHAVVELDGGGRIYVQMTDCPAEQVEIDMPLELTFRKYHEGFGMNNYFWKARPAA
ncbi:MAG TPA: OB-fold domain-containing protein [Candidatus Binatia bacterium]|nr:OB-fold domain-containing protein [Candidatus Binatia bacterium]